MHSFLSYLVDRDLVLASAAEQLGARLHLAREPIGMIAVHHGILSTLQIDTILDTQRTCADRFGEIAVRLGFLSEEQVGTLIKIQEFRTAGAITELLALAGLLRYEDAVRHLGAYLTADDEVAAMMSNP